MIDDKVEQSQVGSITTLYVFVMLALATATVTEYGKGKRTEFVSAYCFVGVATIVAMCLLVTAVKITGPSPNKGKSMFAHDRTTVVVGKWLILCSAILLAIFAKKGFSGSWLGQQNHSLEIKDVGFDKFPDGLPAIRLDVVVDPDNFRDGVPSDWKLITELDPIVAKDWTVSKVERYKIVSHYSKRLAGESTPLGHVGLDFTPVTTNMFGFDDPAATYLVEVYLRPCGNDVEKFDETFGALGDKEKQAAVKTLFDRYQIKAEEARDEIKYHGGASAHWQD